MLPAALLLLYAVAFAAGTFGVAPLAFDDHPGQLARLWHVVREGPAPWAWNAGWWAGYPEMQFYPPGWFYAGALLSWATFGTLAPPAAYQTLLWVTYFAPGLTAFLFLRAVLGDSWRALPGAFIVLTFTGDPAGGTASGVEGGVHIGMVAARLAWALLPLLSVTLVRWTDAGGRFPRLAIVIVAAIVITHPAHAAAATAVLGGAALAAPAPRRALAQSAVALLVGFVLVAFWVVPLLLHLEETRALAWGALSLWIVVKPLPAVLVVLAIIAVRHRGGRAWSAALHAVWMSAAAVAVDALAVEPLGLRFLPADRIADGAWMILLIASGLGAGVVVDALRRERLRPATACVLIAGCGALSFPGGTLTLWGHAADWPSDASITRGLRLADLWQTLRDGPPGRVLFIRSGVPLVHGTAWYRAHTHVTALTPLVTGREILGGTFTHGSPIASLVYRGDTTRAPLTTLAEQLDGRSLFGRPLETLDVATFDDHARRFRVATVVALEDDAPHLPFVTENPRYRRVARPPFLVFVAGDVPTPAWRVGPSLWEIAPNGRPGAWTSTGIAYYPLWRAQTDGGALATRRGAHGDLEIKLQAPATTVRLVYGPGIIELGAVAVSVVGAVALAAEAAWARRYGA